MTRIVNLTPRSRLCQCSACQTYFASPTGFDAHRRGGKCLSRAQLRRRGWKLNAHHGYWSMPREGKQDAGDEVGTLGGDAPDAEA